MLKKLFLLLIIALMVLSNCSKNSNQLSVVKTITGMYSDVTPYELNIISENGDEFAGLMKWPSYKTWIYVEGNYPTKDSIVIAEKYYAINEISQNELGEFKGKINNKNIEGLSTSGSKFYGVIDNKVRSLTEFENYVWKMVVKEKDARQKIEKLNTDVLAYYRKQNLDITEKQAKAMRSKVAKLSLPILQDALNLDSEMTEKIDENSSITPEILDKEMSTRLNFLSRFINYNDVNAKKYQQLLDMLEMNYPGYFLLTEMLFQFQMDNKYSKANFDDEEIKKEYYQDQKDFYTRFINADIFYEDKVVFIFSFAYNVLGEYPDYQQYLWGEIIKLEANENLDIDDQIDRMKKTVTSIVKAAKMKGQPAPQILHTDINGQQFDLSAQKGKVVFLEYWATWCGPCKKATPKLVELYEKYKDNKDFVMVSVALDNLTSVQGYVKEHNMGWIQLVPDTDPWNSALAVDYAITGVPTAFLIDRDGVVKERLHPGDPELESKLAEMLK